MTTHYRAKHAGAQGCERALQHLAEGRLAALRLRLAAAAPARPPSVLSRACAWSRARPVALTRVRLRAQGMLEMHRRYGVARAFVCTDDPSIIEQVLPPPATLHFYARNPTTGLR